MPHLPQHSMLIAGAQIRQHKALSPIPIPVVIAAGAGTTTHKHSCNAKQPCNAPFVCCTGHDDTDTDNNTYAETCPRVPVGFSYLA